MWQGAQATTGDTRRIDVQLAMIGLGRMGANLVRRLRADGHECVVHDRDPALTAELGDLPGVTPAADLDELVALLVPPRTVWVMVPAAVVGAVLDDLAPRLAAGDTVIDGGNSHYRDAITRSAALAERGIDLLDIGTSGGIFGLERGYCLMIGGPPSTVERLQPIFTSLAPGIDTAARTPGRTGPPTPAEQGWLHCGPSGAGHFVKMVHNGIEYGMMAAFAEGLGLLAAADAGDRARRADAETTPLRDPDAYRFAFDLAAITEVWRRGSVVSSWLLDLTAGALHADPGLDGYAGHVSDSGEGRWTVHAAVDVGVPAPVLTAALYSRFASRGEADVSNRLLSAMRRAFGGHLEPPVVSVDVPVDGPNGGAA
jgi:6-phosphogluconate dehydrogenase